MLFRTRIDHLAKIARMGIVGGLLIAISGPGLAFAQLSTGSIVGTVQDQSGALVPNATVIAVKEDTGTSRSTSSNSHGDFSLNSLEPGPYTLTFTSPGFKTKKVEHLTLTTGETLPVTDLKLELGSVTETTTVSAQGAQVMTASSERADLLSTKQIDDLVVRGRNFTDLTSLLPGVIDTTKSNSVSDNPAIYVNGNRDTTNAMFIDGIPADDMSSTQMKDMISQDAVDEVKVETSNYQAEYGRQAGSNIVAVTKSGTRDFHGLASYFNRNEDYNANDYFSKRNGIPRARYRFNTITYDVSGPVVIPHAFNHARNKLFFFFLQEIWPTTTSSSGSLTVPTALERTGDFSQSYMPGTTTLYPVKDPFLGNTPFPGNKITTTDPNGLALLNAFPLPNFSNTAVSKGAYNYVFSVPLNTPVNTQTLRMDYHPTEKDTISGSYNGFTVTSTGSVGGTANSFTFPEAIDSYSTRSKAESIRWLHIIRPTLLNEAHFGFLYQPADQAISSDQLQLVQRSHIGFNAGQFFPGANPLGIVPNATFGGITDAASIAIASRFPLINRYALYNYSDDVTYTRGTHNIRAGAYVEYYTRYQKTQGTDVFNGAFDFTNNASNNLNTGYAYANAALGVFNTYNETSTNGLFTLQDYDVEGYLQDNWRVTHKLTVDYGVRFYYVQPFTELRNNVSGFVPSTYNPANAVKLIGPTGIGATREGIDPGTGKLYPAAAIGAISPSVGNPSDGMVSAMNPGSLPNSLEKGTGLELGPRLGFAYDVHGNGTLAIRGGFGVFRNRFSENYFDNFVAQQPLAQSPELFYGQLSTFLSSSGLLFPSTVYGPDIQSHLPLITNYSLSIQQQIGFNTIMDLAYVGSQSRHLPWLVDLNAIPLGADFLAANQDPTKPGSPLPNSFYRPTIGYGSIYQLSNGADANYNALQLSLQRRFAHMINFGVAYTWSKTMDYADTDTTTMVRVVPTRQYYYSLASFDTPQILEVNFLYDLPKVRWNNGFAKSILNNWQLSGIGNFQSGQPLGMSFTTSSGEDVTGTASVAPRVVVKANPNLPRGQRTFSQYFNTADVSLPAVGTYGNTPRLFIRGPGVNDWDLGLMKNVVFPHGITFVLRTEAYNAFNHTQFSTINTSPIFNSATGAQTNPLFGQVTASRTPRQLQLSGRLTF